MPTTEPLCAAVGPLLYSSTGDPVFATSRCLFIFCLMLVVAELSQFDKTKIVSFSRRSACEGA